MQGTFHWLKNGKTKFSTDNYNYIDLNPVFIVDELCKYATNMLLVAVLPLQANIWPEILTDEQVEGMLAFNWISFSKYW